MDSRQQMISFLLTIMRTPRILAVSFLFILSLPIAFAAETGKVTSVVDGDTFKAKIGTKVETIRIIGIDTPETVDPRKPVQCFGIEASKKLKALLVGKSVSLIANPAEDRDMYKRLLRYVELGSKDIGAAMIADGYAFSYKEYPHPRLVQYNKLETEARGASKGLWRACPSSGGQNVSAASQNRSSSAPVGTSRSSAASGSATKTQCSIKGNVSAKNEKIYHLPSCGSYKQTVIDEASGERWFCSEQEAKNAGWRKAVNCP